MSSSWIDSSDHTRSRGMFLCPVGLSSLGIGAKNTGVFMSGGLFAVGIWLMIDISLVSRFNYGGTAHVSFIDWIPALCSLLGSIIINSLDKSHLSGGSTSFSFGTSNQIAWKIRSILFLGFALLAGGLAGSICVMVLKYMIHGYPLSTQYFGIANAIANGVLMLSSSILWVASTMEDDYNYSLSF